MFKREKRRFRRVPIELIINCYLPEKESGKKNRFKCSARDISPKGIRVVTSKDLSVGSELVLLLEKPLALIPILVKGRIIWIRRLEEATKTAEPSMQVGIEFVHISPYGYNKLDELMDNVEENNRLVKQR